MVLKFKKIQEFFFYISLNFQFVSMVTSLKAQIDQYLETLVLDTYDIYKFKNESLTHLKLQQHFL